MDVVNYFMKKVCVHKGAFTLNCWHCEHAQLNRHVLENSTALKSLSERCLMHKATNKKMHSNINN